MRRQNDNIELGSDSFLDVMSNMVGILIILVVMVGARLKQTPKEVLADAWKENKATPAAAEAAAPPAEAAPATFSTPVIPETPLPEEPEIDLHRPRQAAQTLADDLSKLAGEYVGLGDLVQLRQEESLALADEIAMRQRRLEELRRQLGAEERATIELAAEVEQLKRALAKQQQDLEAVRLKSPKPMKVQSYTTPIGRTVHGDQIFYQLQGGRITLIPMQALLKRAADDLKRQIHKLHSQQEISTLVGPIEGFRMRYVITRKDPSTQDQLNGLRSSDVLENSVLIPVDDQLGETLKEALRPDSSFRLSLAQINPGRHTVTLWVYPDSFEIFRGINEELHRLGFATAARPLPPGTPIGSSNEGSRSVAQ